MTGLLFLAGLAGVIFILYQSQASAMTTGLPASEIPTELPAPTIDIVPRFAQAIARAEGFYVSGSRPQRNHNPGDMTQDLIGKGIGRDGPFVVYANDQDGWSNLYAQIQLWLSGQSAFAGPDSTISDLSRFYT